MKYYIDKPDTSIKKIVTIAYPNYNGKKIAISDFIPSNLNSYWDGGSRDYFVFYHLDENKAIPVHSNHPYFEATQPRLLGQLPDRVLLVQHTIFCGKDLGITIYANKTDLQPMLPNNVSVSSNESIVLEYTASLKSSYAGIKNYRYHKAHRQTKINLEQWESAKNQLIIKKLLNKAGAITPAGRNARNSQY